MTKITYYSGTSINIHQILNNNFFPNDDSSIIICDLTDIIVKYHLWRTLIPRVTPFYAVKCNDSYPILKVLNDLKIGFDCASKNEIDMIVNLGCSKDRILYANPCKIESHLKFAKNMQVYTMTFDNDYELKKIHKHYPDANLILRFRYDAKKALCSLGKKFGCDSYTEAPALLQLAKYLKLNVIGVSFHVGSDCLDYTIYEDAMGEAKKLLDLGNSIGFYMKVVDIGGGFSGDHNSLFIEASKYINSGIDKYFPNNNNDIILISEPGRFFVGSSMIVLCKIHSKREIRDSNGNIKEIMYYLNDGAWGTFNQVVTCGPAYAVSPKLLKTENKTEKQLVYKSCIWGPTCDSMDLLCGDIYLPNMNIDDALVFENLGAYTLPFRTTFNGFSIPRIEYFINRQFKMQPTKNPI